MTFAKPKKSLGQNFLIQPNIVAKIIHVATVALGEPVLEIGPGRGILTRALLDAGAHVTAVEKDDALFTKLHETFAKEISSKKLVLVHADVLDFLNSPELHAPSSMLRPQRFTVVANIPYYITGELIRILLSGTFQPNRMTLLVQKEVAERIMAIDGNESILSLSIKAFGTPKHAGIVGRGNFYPVPKVDSAILCINEISKRFFDTISETRFFEVIHAGFAHRRKYVLRNLEAIAPKENIRLIFDGLGLNPKIRAERLTLADWGHLVEKL